MSERELTALLLNLGVAIRDQLRADRLAIAHASRVVETGGADTIFGLDRHVEPLMLTEIEAWPKHMLPVGLFAEGLSTAPLIVGGNMNSEPKYWLLIDPVDGTRGLMYEKRSAYFLAAAAPGSCANPRLSDCVTSVAVEIAPPKAGYADIFAWTAGENVRAERRSLVDGALMSTDLVRPSTAEGLSDAFGTVVAFFPMGKSVAAELAEQIAAANNALIFEDQYISSGGQMIELLTGHDRFIVDIRPLLSRERSACCHPYDLALAPLAKAAGVILCAPDGGELDAPFDLNLDVGWCGYANAAIKEMVHPIVERFAVGRT